MHEPLRYGLASVGDDDLDDFNSGDPEVDKYFSSRQWFVGGKYSPETYQFRTADNSDVVGYAAAGFRNLRHPEETSEVKARYLAIMAVGIHKHLHGHTNPAATGDTYATSLFNILERWAREKPQTVGLHLWVRNGNARAIAFYTRFGFKQIGRPIQRDLSGGDPHLTMRKLL